MFNTMRAQFDIILYNKNLSPTRLISAPLARPVPYHLGCAGDTIHSGRGKAPKSIEAVARARANLLGCIPNQIERDFAGSLGSVV